MVVRCHGCRAEPRAKSRLPLHEDSRTTAVACMTHPAAAPAATVVAAAMLGVWVPTKGSPGKCRPAKLVDGGPPSSKIADGGFYLFPFGGGCVCPQNLGSPGALTGVCPRAPRDRSAIVHMQSIDRVTTLTWVAPRESWSRESSFYSSVAERQRSVQESSKPGQTVRFFPSVFFPAQLMHLPYSGISPS